MMLIPDSGAGGETPKLNSLPGVTVSGASDGVPSDNTEDEWSRGSGEDPDLEIESIRGPGGDDVTELDRKVQQATRLMQKNCNCANGKCSKLKVRKVGEGKYNIAGKNVFVRVSCKLFRKMCDGKWRKFIIETKANDIIIVISRVRVKTTKA